jgi:DNA-directed RNA polymerase subunit omega
MKSPYLDDAVQRFANPELLINVVSRRVRQLNQGHRPLIEVTPKMQPVDIALKEILDGKLTFEFAEEQPAEVPAATTA